MSIEAIYTLHEVAEELNFAVYDVFVLKSKLNYGASFICTIAQVNAGIFQVLCFEPEGINRMCERTVKKSNGDSFSALSKETIAALLNWEDYEVYKGVDAKITIELGELTRIGTK